MRGDVGERNPFTPVPADRQRQALHVLAREIFNPEPWRVPAGYLSKLEANPYQMADAYADAGFPLRDGINRVRAGVLLDLMSPVRLRRMASLESGFTGPGQTLSLTELFPTVRTAIWGPLPANVVVPASQRDLQRVHLRLLIALEKGTDPDEPADARAVAESELHQLKAALVKPRLTSPDAYTRLHFAEAIRRIDTALREKL